LDGVIDEFLVQPNQAVQTGSILFSLDATALQTRHAVARKAYDTAKEEYRQSAQLAVSDDKGKLDMALRRGALEEKSEELAYTSEQLGRVQVKAEHDGVAVFADVNDWLGKAVILGEKVLTLADPHQVELAIQLPVGDSIDVEPGTAITLYPNGNPLRSFDARIIHAAYHAEPLPDGRLVYRLKARFVNTSELPRIGLMGTAKVYGGWVPLAYYVLRRPLTSLRQWVGW
jgi:multidrug resistance efflux pump